MGLYKHLFIELLLAAFVSARGIPSEGPTLKIGRQPYKWMTRPLAIPRHSSLADGRFLNWPSFNRPIVQFQGPDVKSVPVHITSADIPFRVIVDPLLNVSVANSALPVQVLNNSLNVKVLDTPLPVGIVNTSLPVNITNAKLQVDVTNVPLPVGVINDTLGVRVRDLPLPVGIVNTTLPVRVDSSVPLDTRILNTPLPVGVVNSTLTVNVANTPLAVDVMNSPLPVGVVNQTLSVTLADKPVPVGIVNQSLPVNVTNLLLNTTVLNVPLPVGIVNTTLNVTVMNTPLPVVLLNETIEVNSTMLLSGITDLIKNMTTDILNVTTRKYCPTDTGFGVDGTVAPCRSLGNSCYCFFPTLSKTFVEGTTFCQTAGFDGLVSLETRAEQNALQDLAKLLGIPESVYYTSGSDEAVEGSFIWTAKNTPFAANMLWGAGEPQGGTPTEDCVVIGLSGLGELRDTECSNAFNFVCEVNNIQNAIG